MRWRILLFIIAMLTIGACTPAEESTPVASDGEGAAAVDTSPEPTPQAIVVVTRNFDDEPTAEGALPIPIPGTLVASETEDPDAGLIFDRIYLVRTGIESGEAIRDEIELLQDGQFTRNGRSGIADTNTIARIDEWIDTVNFYGMQGAMLGPSSETDDYRYSLTIERNGLERTINSQDGFMPIAYMNLLGEILLVGLQN